MDGGAQQFSLLQARSILSMQPAQPPVNVRGGLGCFFRVYAGDKGHLCILLPAPRTQSCSPPAMPRLAPSPAHRSTLPAPPCPAPCHPRPAPRHPPRSARSPSHPTCPAPHASRPAPPATRTPCFLMPPAAEPRQGPEHTQCRDDIQTCSQEVGRGAAHRAVPEHSHHTHTHAKVK